MNFTSEPGRIFAESAEGVLLAEITFPLAPDGAAVIDHTFVDPSLRGQGTAEQLVRAALVQIAARGLSFRAVCPYAVRWLAHHPELSLTAEQPQQPQ